MASVGRADSVETMVVWMADFIRNNAATEVLAQRSRGTGGLCPIWCSGWKCSELFLRDTGSCFHCPVTAPAGHLVTGQPPKATMNKRNDALEPRFFEASLDGSMFWFRDVHSGTLEHLGRKVHCRESAMPVSRFPGGRKSDTGETGVGLECCLSVTVTRVGDRAPEHR